MQRPVPVRITASVKPYLSMMQSVVDEWRARGWPLEDLHTFRMEGGAGEGGAGDGAGGAGDGAAGAGDGAGGTGDGAGAGEGAGEGKSVDDQLKEAIADIEKWKSTSRKHEDRAKSNADAAKELDALKKSQMSDTDKVVTEARDAARKEALGEFGMKLAGAEIKAALTGVVDDPAAIVEDLNLAKYVTDDGEVDSEAIGKLREKFEAIAKPGTGGGGTGGSGPDLKQGNRGEPAPGQLTRAELQKMSPEEIEKARSEGRLNELLGIKS